MNILILGANGAIARIVEKSIINDPAFKDMKITMFLRAKSRVDDLLSPQTSAIEGDLLNLKSLEAAVEDQDIVIDTTGATRNLETTKNIIEAMLDNGVIRVISINDLGIYDEVPGKFGQWNKEQVGQGLEIGKQSAKLYEESDLDYTILRLAWLNNETTIHYELTQKGEAFKGTTVSRASVADVMLKIIDDPDYLLKKDVGIDQPGTEGDKPVF